MDTIKHQKAEAAIAAIQKKQGAKAIHQGISPVTSEYFTTGFPSLDNLIGGGLSSERFTEIIGAPTSGMNTIALNVMAAAQRAKHEAIYIDLPTAFDPAAARSCGIDIADLTLIRDDIDEAIAWLSDIILIGIPSLVVFNSLPRLTYKQQASLAQTIQSLIPSLGKSRSTLVVLTMPSGNRSLISGYATLRLHTAFDRWLVAEDDFYGYQAVATIVKHKVGGEGRKAPLRIMLDPKTVEDET